MSAYVTLKQKEKLYRNPNEAEIDIEDKMRASASEDDSHRINKSGPTATDKDFFESNPLKGNKGLVHYGAANTTKQAMTISSADAGLPGTVSDDCP